MATIEDKIKQFRAEVGNRTLTPEQQELFRVFCRTGGKPHRFVVTDTEGRSINLYVSSDKTSDGTQHILLRHFGTKRGRVTAGEILNMLDVVRKGDRVAGDATHYAYKLTRKSNGVLYTVGVKINKNTHRIKSFYSNRGY